MRRCLWALFLFAPLRADDWFESRVRPVLAENCYGCHAAAETAGLRVDSREALLKGGRSGPAIVPGDPESSLLVAAIRHTHDRFKMPPGRQLSLPQRTAIEEWVRRGAVWPAVTAPAQSAANARQWWSFQPLRAPAAGETIDSLIAERLRLAGIPPAARADRRTLLRRAAFDLTGLPPAPEAMEAFLRDRSPGAFAAAVDRLLASPHFGERWARHWLDVARYAEDDVLGLSQESYPNAWRYRDWVIGALNRDLPYDQFVKAQIAGDLLPNSGPEWTAALGFFGLGPWYYTIAPPPQARADERHDRIDAVTRGFLGITAACARCHDHKFDPVSVHDYHALGGVFASSEYREYPLAPAETVERYERHQQRIQDHEKMLREFVQAQDRAFGEMQARKLARYLLAVDGGDARGLDGEILERLRQYLAQPKHDHPFLEAWKRAPAADRPRLAHELQQRLLDVMAAKKEIDEENELALARTRPPKNAPKVRLPNGFTTYDEFCPGCAVEARSLDRDSYVLWSDFLRPRSRTTGGIFSMGEEGIARVLSGEWKAHLDEMRAALEDLRKTAPPAYPYLHGLGERAAPVNLRIAVRGNPYNLGDEVPRGFLTVLADGPAPFRKGSGRLELAEAIVAHPLAARVAANRIWGHLMGTPIVSTPSNFGRMGGQPSHPQLLELLAHSLREDGWSVKRLIRRIVLSEAYQRAAVTNEAGRNKDPDNRLYWRGSRRRLDAEALRDAMLFTAGTLDARIGGPSVDLSKDASRRTIYGKVSRFRLDETLALFDFPSPSISSEKRNVTQVPLQSLYLANSAFVQGQAAALAERLQRAAATDAERLRAAWRIVYGRDPAASERDLSLQYLRTAGWKELAQALLISNEFLFVD